MAGGVAPLRLCVVVPIFNDWIALAALLAELDRVFCDGGVRLEVIVVNDASTVDRSGGILSGCRHGVISRAQVLNLRANVGHQLAIAAGLRYAAQNATFDAIVVMDADGEDQPDDVPKLVEAWRAAPDSLIVARRAKRSESPLFKGFYSAYRLLFRILTGQNISFGNFSLVPAPLLPGVLSRPELVHHLAATLLRTKLRIINVPTRRGLRYAGQSHMNLPALVLHAVAAFSVFSDVLFSRILIWSSAFGLLCGIGVIAVTVLRLLTDLAIPGWATTAAGMLTMLAVQIVLLVLCTGFLLLSNRSSMLLTTLETSHLIESARVLQ